MNTGTITQVWVNNAGAFLLGDHATGVTQLQVEDAADFEETGGTLVVEVEDNPIVLTYTSADLDTDIIYLAAATTVDLAEETPVKVYPLVPEKTAVVISDDAEETVNVRVPNSLYAQIEEGFREPEVGERITYSLQGGQWVIDDILGVEPLINGAYVDVPSLEIPASDGLAPGFSPTPTVIGGLGSLFVKWSPIANADLVTYEVHVSTSSGFTPDSSTLIQATAASSLNIREDIAYGTTYYVRIIAKDVDGSADPSPEVSGTSVQVTNDDISSNYIYAGTISVNNLTGGTLQSDMALAGTIKTAESGGRVEMNTSGIIVYKPDNTPTTILSTNGQSTFKGLLEAEAATFTGPASFRDDANEIAQSAVLTMQASTTQSKVAPSVVVGYDQSKFKDSTGADWTTAVRSVSRNGNGTFFGVYDSQRVQWNSSLAYDSVVSTSISYTFTHSVRPTNGEVYSLEEDSGTDNFYIHRGEGEATNYTTWLETFSDLTAWTTSGTASAASGQAKIDVPTSGTSSISRQAAGLFVTKSVEAKMTLPAADADGTVFKMELSKDLNNRVSMYVQGSTLYFSRVSAGSSNLGSTTYNPTSMAYWKIAETAGSIQFFTSPDGVTWTWKRTTTHAISDANLTDMTLTILGEQESGAAKSLYVDNVRYGFKGTYRNFGTRANITYKPIMFTNGTNLYTVEFNANTYVIKTIDKDTLRVTSTLTTGTFTGGGQPTGAYLGTADLGTSYFWIAGGTTVTPFTTAGALVANTQFPLPASTNIVGLYYTDAFYSVSDTGTVYKHTGITWTTESSSWKVAYSWATASYETTPSTYTAAFTMVKRAKLTVTSTAIPTSGTPAPDRIKVYVLRGVETAHLQGTPGVGLTTMSLSSINWSGAAPVGASTFPSSTPGQLKSSSGLIFMSGDDSWKFGALYGNATQIGGVTPATNNQLKFDGTKWVPFNPDASDTGWTTFTKVSPSTSMANITLEYRITGKMIEWRTSGNTNAAFTVPGSGDAANQNITTSVPSNLRPATGNWTWVASIGNALFLAVTPGGNVTIFAGEGTGTDYTVPSGTSLVGQSPAFVLP